jgi:hypothetical protein
VGWGLLRHWRPGKQPHDLLNHLARHITLLIPCCLELLCSRCEVIALSSESGDSGLGIGEYWGFGVTKRAGAR